LSIPASAHAATEMVTITGTARLSVFDVDGQPVCALTGGMSRFTTCGLRPGEPYTMLVEGPAAKGSTWVTRRDMTAGAGGCTPVAASPIGVRSASGSLAALGDVRCHKLAAAAGDRFWVDTRDAGAISRYVVLDPAGQPVNCLSSIRPCRVTGAAGYQVFVWTPTTSDTPAGGYDLDAWRLPAEGGTPPAECPIVPSVATGFGPLTGVLTPDRPARCVAAHLGRLDSFTVTTDGPVPFMVTDRGISECHNPNPERSCTPFLSDDATVLFVLTPGDVTGRMPYRVTAACDQPACGGGRATARRSPGR
jgi:hypothetical protein